jgi:hypothetical protein
MQKFRLRLAGSPPGRRTLCLIGIALALVFVAGADGALVRVGRLVVHADGGFTPRTLPRHSFAPIDFKGHVDITSTDSGPVPTLQRVRLDFDRDGRLGTRGLPVCRPVQIERTSPKVARRRCKGALVGTGHIDVAIPVFGGLTVTLRSPASVFNGPRQGGNPTVVGHAQVPFLGETYVLAIPIERLHGAFAYRATVDVPPIAGGTGAITHVDGKIGRRYRSGGVDRSYTSARCSDGVLETRGRLDFTDGTVIEGSVYKPCAVRTRRSAH